jgi:hypothetical protein
MSFDKKEKKEFNPKMVPVVFMFIKILVGV